MNERRCNFVQWNCSVDKRSLMASLPLHAFFEFHLFKSIFDMRGVDI